MTADYLRNLEALGVDTIDHFPKATDNIDEIIRLTQVLIDKGFAYASEGDVYFDVAKDTGYGKLSRRTAESLQGEGGDMAERKRSPGDFALWKSAKPGEPAWDSPWGKGRPGWHIECSAMSRAHFGRNVRHPRRRVGFGVSASRKRNRPKRMCPRQAASEILAAQRPDAGRRRSRQNRWPQHPRRRCHFGCHWLRQCSGESASRAILPAQQTGKISKSTGASAFRDLLERHQPETIRFFLLSTHYRSPIQYSEELLRETARSLDGFYRFFQRWERVSGRQFFDLPLGGQSCHRRVRSSRAIRCWWKLPALRKKFIESMDDDFNTGAATAALFEILRALNKFVDTEKLEAGKPDAAKVATLERGATVLRELAGVLGSVPQTGRAEINWRR